MLTPASARRCTRSVVPSFAKNSTTLWAITPPKPSFTSQNTYSMLAMVSHNLGVCILPELVVRDISKNVVRLPLNPPMERVLGVRIPSAKKGVPSCQPADRAAAADSV